MKPQINANVRASLIPSTLVGYGFRKEMLNFGSPPCQSPSRQVGWKSKNFHAKPRPPCSRTSRQEGAKKNSDFKIAAKKFKRRKGDEKNKS